MDRHVKGERGALLNGQTREGREGSITEWTDT